MSASWRCKSGHSVSPCMEAGKVPAEDACLHVHPQWRARCYYKVMAFGRSPWGRLALALRIKAAGLWQWVCLLFLGLLEYLTERNPCQLKPAKARKAKAA